ncbi:carboxylesterase/lipase family protein [Goodfellowiella coeruleoviolacea]|uniref:Carboxylic ester hydrolase n=1 Tax=Goodfellowiella coeruleoviolacea TaxID=334858 RepID=A0AAE3KJ62_9PSEU|nr:carboxylesterase family protein [Goodfellowiella coeruleoviolacea]MCP2168682.1 para-nitrobenzyl esterase [Goodfellowiella coeruleoviolacea]
MKWRSALLAACSAIGLLATGLTGSATAAPDGVYDLVRTDLGLVRGTQHDRHETYKGIPYAAPPVGELRWRAPQPAKPWEGVLDATNFRSQCAQLGGLGGIIESYEEDCLYLNVTTPSRLGKRPVVVWFYGGGFQNGTSSTYDASKLADQGDVVVVTVNYRVGALGFMALPSLDGENPGVQSGNYGIEDQQAAMRWVQRNAAAFGGDPGNVTLAGQSAGAGSICIHLASPTAAGLFHRAIGETFSCDAKMLTKDQAETIGTSVAEQFGCADASTAADCLRGKPVPDLMKAWPPLPQGPVVGGKELPMQPGDALRQGKFNKVPMLWGNNLDEMRMIVSVQYDGSGNPVTPTMYEEIIRSTYGAYADQVLQRYPLANYPTPGIALSAVQTDAGNELLSTCPHLRGYQAATATGSAPLYVYQFADRTAPPVVDIPGFDEGAEHSVELNYLFPNFMGPLKNAEQEKLSDTMVNYWTTFARTGNPNGNGEVNWPRYRSAADVLSLDIAPGGIHTVDIEKNSHCGFWATVPNAA